RRAVARPATASETTRSPAARRSSRRASEEEGESDFPFLEFLVVVAAREHHAVLVFAADEEAPCEIKAKSRAVIGRLVVPVHRLRILRVLVHVEEAAPERHERREAPLRHEHVV